MEHGTLKTAPSAIEKRALAAAKKAATTTHDAECRATNATSTMHVSGAVVAAARAAYVSAGGRRELVVWGWGNSTHPVCGVEAGIKKIR